MMFGKHAILNYGDKESARKFLELVRSEKTPEAFVQITESNRRPRKASRPRASLREISDRYDDQIAALWAVVKLTAAAALTLTRSDDASGA